MATKYTTRKVRLDFDSPLPPIGSTVALVRCTDESTGETWHTLDESPRTNLSGEECWQGWLGSTNGVSARALGKRRLVTYVELDPWTQVATARLATLPGEDQ